MDITVFLNDFLSIMVSLVSWCFSLLDSISFWGTSLLRFIISVFIIGILLNLLVSAARANTIKSLRKSSDKGKSSKEGDSK